MVQYSPHTDHLSILLNSLIVLSSLLIIFLLKFFFFYFIIHFEPISFRHQNCKFFFIFLNTSFTLNSSACNYTLIKGIGITFSTCILLAIPFDLFLPSFAVAFGAFCYFCGGEKAEGRPDLRRSELDITTSVRLQEWLVMKRKPSKPRIKKWYKYIDINSFISYLSL